MARPRKPRPIPLSEVRPGDVFLAPLQDGRLSACRVLQVAADHSQALVAGSTWIGTEPPDLTDPRLRQVFGLNHHPNAGEPDVLWVSDPVPATFTRLGTIAPTKKQSGLKCLAMSGWEYFPHQ